MTTTAPVTPAPVAPAPIPVRIRIGVSDALLAGHTHAGEAAVIITPEWLASLSPEEREVLAASEADLRSRARRSAASGGVATEPAAAPTLDEARRVLTTAVAAIRRDEARHAAEAQAQAMKDAAQAMKDAARRVAVETARQACAALVAQWTSAPWGRYPALAMRRGIEAIETACAAATGTTTLGSGLSDAPEHAAAWRAVREREEAERHERGERCIAEVVAAAEAGTRHWDGRSRVSYSVVTDAGGVEHIEAHAMGDEVGPVLADEAHPLRARILAVRAAARAQVRAAIEATEPEALPQFDAGRITAGRIRALVAYAALGECSAYPGGVAHREAPYIPQPRTGPVSAAAWRAWLTARDEAATITREMPWARVVAYPTTESGVTLVALVGGGAYVYTCDADETDD